MGKSAGKRKILAFLSFNSDVYARILRPFTLPRSMRQYAHERQVRRITSTIPYNKNNEAVLRKNMRERKSGEFRKRFSAKLRFALAFRSAFRFCYGVCLSGGAKRRHLSVTSTRRGRKLDFQAE